jgi:hypothetical protein
VVVVTTKLNSKAVPGSALAIKWFGARMGIVVEGRNMEGGIGIRDNKQVPSCGGSDRQTQLNGCARVGSCN